MNARVIVPVAIFVVGIALIAAAVATGEAEVSLLLVFPVISGSSGLFVLGTVMILLSFVVGFALMAMGQLEVSRADIGRIGAASRPSAKAGETRYGGVVLIGPVPIAFGSDQRMALIMLVVGIVIAIVALGLLLFLAQ
jgi:uncharacterized protein (TIGR00304 family)